MRIPNTEHRSRPWRIHQILPDFRLEDVWELPGEGGPGDFPRVVELMARFDPENSSSRAVRALFAIRWKLGELFGWDDSGDGIGERVPSLRDRLPDDLRDGPRGPEFGATPFTSLYMTDDEWAAEIANKTMHGVLHLSWVPESGGTYRARMAVYVKPNGWLGNAYMAFIRPFRHALVYPVLLREGGQMWRELAGGSPSGDATR